MKRIALFLTSCALSILFALPAPARATPAGPNYLIRSNSAPAYCMDASLDHNHEGREVYIFRCHGRYNQRWTFTPRADGWSGIVGFDGHCIDIRGRQVRDNSPVQLFRCGYAANQLFQLTSLGQIRERQSGKCLTIGKRAANRRPVFIDDCDGQPAQLWSVQH